MAFIVHCREVGFDCDGVVRAETVDELLGQVAAHAKSVHGLTEISEEVLEKVKSVIQEEE